GNRVTGHIGSSGLFLGSTKLGRAGLHTEGSPSYRGGMRKSCYTLPFEVPGRSDLLLMHGYTGAMDIVRSDVAEDLRSLDEAPVSRIQSKALLETLVERGYLTELTQEQEHDHIKQILALFKRKSASSISFAFQLHGPSSAIQQTFVKRLDAAFMT